MLQKYFWFGFGSAFLPSTPFSGSTPFGEKPWGANLPQAFFSKSFACLAKFCVFFSQLLPLFIGSFVIVRWSSWEKVEFSARQAAEDRKEVFVSC